MKRSLTIILGILLSGQLCLAQGTITTIAGNGSSGYSGDGMPATNAAMHDPNKLFVDSARNIYIADGLYNNVVRKVNGLTGTITTIAGTGIAGTTGDGNPATAGKLNGPAGVYVNAAGDVFITEASGNVIRKIDAATGIISTIAGIGVPGYSGDGALAVNARLWVPNGITGDTAGNIYFSEYGSSTVRKITAATGIITTIAGTGTVGTSVDGGSAIHAPLNRPEGLCVDKIGNVYVVDGASHRIRKIAAATGIITTVAGNSIYGYTGDGGPATIATLFNPSDVAVDATGNIYIADASNNAIRKVNPAGKISTIAGTGISGYLGDGDNSIHARLYGPSGISVTSSGIVYVVDGGNNVVRKIAAPTTANTVIPHVAVQVFPNPAKDELHISGVQNETAYKIINMLGIEVQTGTLVTGDNTISIGNIVCGMYMLELDEQQAPKTVLRIVKNL